MEPLHAGFLDTVVIFAAAAWILRGLVKAHESRYPTLGARAEPAPCDDESPLGEEECADTELLWLPDELDP